MPPAKPFASFVSYTLRSPYPYLLPSISTIRMSLDIRNVASVVNRPVIRVACLFANAPRSKGLVYVLVSLSSLLLLAHLGWMAYLVDIKDS